MTQTFNERGLGFPKYEWLFDQPGKMGPFLLSPKTWQVRQVVEWTLPNINWPVKQRRTMKPKQVGGNEFSEHGNKNEVSA